MCGYDPFYWYEKDLDDEYLERIGGNMHGFEQAQTEYERKMTAPFDEGGALCEEDNEYLTKEEYDEMEAESLIDEIQLERAFG